MLQENKKLFVEHRKPQFIGDLLFFWMKKVFFFCFSIRWFWISCINIMSLWRGLFQIRFPLQMTDTNQLFAAGVVQNCAVAFLFTAIPNIANLWTPSQEFYKLFEFLRKSDFYHLFETLTNSKTKTALVRTPSMNPYPPPSSGNHPCNARFNAQF